MNDSVFQSVYEALARLLPSGWKKLVFYAMYTESGYSMKFFVKQGLGRCRDCFTLHPDNTAELLSAFAGIHGLLAPEREMLPEEKQWTVFTLTVSRSGGFSADYDYESHAEELTTWEDAWRERYL